MGCPVFYFGVRSGSSGGGYAHGFPVALRWIDATGRVFFEATYAMDDLHRIEAPRTKQSGEATSRQRPC